jgi:hypothetical protein
MQEEQKIKVIGDYYKNFIVGIQEGTDHQPLIRLKNPLILQYFQKLATKKTTPRFQAYDTFCPPKELRVKAVVMYDAGEELIRHYKEHCAKIFGAEEYL